MHDPKPRVERSIALADGDGPVVPYLVVRHRFAARLHHQRTGYGQPDEQGLQVFTPAEQAAALGLLADGRHEPFVSARPH